MDDDWAVLPVQHDQFEKVRGLVRSEDEVPVRVFADVIDRERVNECVLNVLGIDAVT